MTDSIEEEWRLQFYVYVEMLNKMGSLLIHESIHVDFLNPF